MVRFDGYLFSKLHLIGDRSEGPSYFLQQWDYGEIPVVKKAMLWEEDPNLHKFLGRKVTIEGTWSQNGIYYDKIMDLQPLETENANKLEIDLRLGADVLWINKMPSVGRPIRQSMPLTLLVRWPYRSIWRGVCPTSQIYDFFIEQGGRVIWQWSADRIFAQVQTPVAIPGGRWVEYPVTWNFDPNDIKDEGTYTARAIFIASGQEVSRDFEVKFAH